MPTITKLLAAASTALVLAAGLSACANGTPSASAALGSADRPVRIGVIGASDPYWQTYEQAAEAEGLHVDIVDFSEYSQPNPALSEGELDLNQFQHILYLAQYDVAANADLVPIGSTAIYPLGLYSTKYASPADIPAGSQIAIPNDESNQARALLVLQSAGLIELADGGSPYSTPDDVLPGSKATVLPVEASLTATSLPDVAGSIINNDFVGNAGLSTSNAIAADDPNDDAAKPYINIFAARKADADNPVYQQLVELYQNDQAVLDGVIAKAGGAAVTLKTPVSELLESLESTEAAYRQAKG